LRGFQLTFDSYVASGFQWFCGS